MAFSNKCNIWSMLLFFRTIHSNILTQKTGGKKLGAYTPSDLVISTCSEYRAKVVMAEPFSVPATRTSKDEQIEFHNERVGHENKCYSGQALIFSGLARPKRAHLCGPFVGNTGKYTVQPK